MKSTKLNDGTKVYCIKAPEAKMLDIPSPIQPSNQDRISPCGGSLDSSVKNGLIPNQFHHSFPGITFHFCDGWPHTLIYSENYATFC